MKNYIAIGVLLFSLNSHIAQDLIETEDNDSSEEIDTQNSEDEMYCQIIFNQENTNEKYFYTSRYS